MTAFGFKCCALFSSRNVTSDNIVVYVTRGKVFVLWCYYVEAREGCIPAVLLLPFTPGLALLWPPPGEELGAGARSPARMPSRHGVGVSSHAMLSAPWLSAQRSVYWKV